MNPLKPVNSTTTFFAGKYPEEKTNEVARLRELLNKITDLAESLSGYYYASLCDMQECPAKEWGKGHQKLLADNLEHFKKEARLAPAPEEPHYPEQDLPTPDEEIAYAKANKKQMSWKQYKRKGLSEMRPYIQGEVLPPCVSISEADLKNGSPKVGDMIARNPKNHDDQWLVAEKYFNDNLELAPAPEESVTQKGGPNKETPLGTTLRSEEYVLAGDKNLEGEFNTVKEPVPEWRELGPDEEIQEGDEVFSLGIWIPVSPNLVIPINDKRKPEVRIRTRRPLPKQEGEQPYCSRCKYNHAFPCEGSLAGVPLEDELSAIEDGNPWIDPSKNILICLRYLRDEIQKLKEAKP